MSGNYRTVMIAQINPAMEFKEEAKNTLMYATKAMGISKRVTKERNLNLTINNFLHPFL